MQAVFSTIKAAILSTIILPQKQQRKIKFSLLDSFSL
jgi:hypothetical protein